MGSLQKVLFHTSRQAATGMRSVTHTQRKSARMFDLSAVDADEIWHFVQVVAGHGDCASFTLTSDGGALTVCILAGNTVHKAFPPTPEILYERLHDLLDELY